MNDYYRRKGEQSMHLLSDRYTGHFTAGLLVALIIFLVGRLLLSYTHGTF